MATAAAKGGGTKARACLTAAEARVGVGELPPPQFDGLTATELPLGAALRRYAVLLARACWTLRHPPVAHTMPPPPRRLSRRVLYGSAKRGAPPRGHCARKCPCGVAPAWSSAEAQLDAKVGGQTM